MAAMLRLQRSDGLRVDVPEGPGLCETCRERPSAPDLAYCDPLCAMFDAALEAHRLALVDADGERDAAPVIRTRTTLRAVAALYDARKLRRSPRDPVTRGAARAWAEDVAAGRILPVPYRTAIGAVARVVDGAAG